MVEQEHARDAFFLCDTLCACFFMKIDYALQKTFLVRTLRNVVAHRLFDHRVQHATLDETT